MYFAPVFVLHRALVFVVKFFDGQVPNPTEKGRQAVTELGAAVAAKVKEYITAMEKVGDITPGAGTLDFDVCTIQSSAWCRNAAIVVYDVCRADASGFLSFMHYSVKSLHTLYSSLNVHCQHHHYSIVDPQHKTSAWPVVYVV